MNPESKRILSANVKLVDSNRELKKENDLIKKIIDEAVNFIYNKSIEYKPNHRKVDLNTKDCCELLDILEGVNYE